MNKKGFKKYIAAALTLLVLGSQSTALFAQDNLKKRSEVADQYKWKLEDIYATTDAFNADMTKIQKTYIPKLKSYQGKLKNADKILEFMKVFVDANRTFDKLYVYSHMKSDEDVSNSQNSELASRTDSLNADFSASTAFFNSELLAKSDKDLKAIINNPKLSDYKHYLEAIVAQKAHTLSKESEEVLALAGDLSATPEDIFNKVTKADYVPPVIKDTDGKDVKLSDGAYSNILENPDRDYRERAVEARATAFSKINNTLSSTLSAEVKKDVFFAKASKYPSALEAALASENVPKSVYDNLVKSVDNNLGYLHKYISLKKSVLGVDKLKACDMYMPLVDTSKYKFEASYDDAKSLVLKGLAPLGEDYLKKFNEGLNSRWIDVYETENKNTGGYQWGAYDTHPFILLNFDGTADSVLTLAHEMGHAMNSCYTNKTQKYINSNVPIFNAEVASTANELFMLDYFVKNSKTDDEKLYFLNQLAEDIKGTVYTQVEFAEFEQVIHEQVEKGEALSADYLNKTWSDIVKKYNGDDYSFNDLEKYGWSRVPHFYMDFYVYKYATSIAASNELVDNVLSGKQGALDNYFKFLSSGSKDYPINVLKQAGVDMTTTKPVDDILKKFGDTVDQIQTILKKQGKIK